MSDVILRTATDSDLDGLVDLARHSFRQAYEETDDPADIDGYVRRYFTREIFSEQLADTSSSLVLAQRDGRHIGYLLTRSGSGPECVDTNRPLELARLYLLREAVGQGIGSRMMGWVLREAERRDCDVVWLQVYERNESARSFYRRHGFEDAGTRPFRFGGRVYHDPLMLRRV